MTRCTVIALAATLVACGGASGPAPERAQVSASPPASSPAVASPSVGSPTVGSPTLACVARWEGMAGARSIPVWAPSEELAMRRARALARYLEARDHFIANLSVMVEESARLVLAPPAPVVTLERCAPLTDAPVGEVVATAIHPAGYRTRARAGSLDLALETARRRACTSGFGAGIRRVFGALAAMGSAQRQALLAEGTREVVEESAWCWRAMPAWEAAASHPAAADAPVVCRTLVAGPVPALVGESAFARGLGAAPTEARARERAWIDASTDLLSATTQTMAAAIAGASPSTRTMLAARAVEAAVTGLSLGPLFEAKWTRCAQGGGPYRFLASDARCRGLVEEPLASLSARASRCDGVSEAMADYVREALDGSSADVSTVVAAAGLAEQLGCVRACRDVVPASGWSLEPAPPACRTRAEAERTFRAGLEAGDVFDAVRCLSRRTQRELLSAMTERGVDPMDVFSRWREHIDPSSVDARETSTGWRLRPAPREPNGER